jgi:hypothetical protein
MKSSSNYRHQCCHGLSFRETGDHHGRDQDLPQVAMEVKPLSCDQIKARRVDELEAGGFRCERPVSTFIAKT